jgi:hypothetical protein
MKSNKTHDRLWLPAALVPCKNGISDPVAARKISIPFSIGNAFGRIPDTAPAYRNPPADILSPAVPAAVSTIVCNGSGTFPCFLPACRILPPSKLLWN